MFNIFLQDYYTRLREWFKLKENIKEYELSTICVEVDKFWQSAPLVNHLLHPDDITDWPNPWELLYQNDYCYYARALGMVYTLLLLGVNDVDFVEALDDNNEHVVLVLVDNAKYTLNYWPNSVLNISLSDFKILKQIDIEPLRKKTGE